MSSGNSSLDGGPNSESLTRSYSVSTADRIRDNIPSRDYDGLKSQCDKAMHELQLLRRQHSETVRRCEHTMKELEYYRGQHHAAMAQLETAAQESSSLRTKYGELVSDLRSSQEGENGNGDAVNQLYLSTLSKYETIKEDYDDLRKRYEDLIANHSSAVNKLELAQEEVGRIKKQCEEMIAERNVAVRERNGLKQQCTAAIRQWDIALRERNEYQEALHKVQQQHEEAVKEVNQAMAVRMKASKDLKRLTEERNAALQEYSLIMSERDTVHKEMEKLSEDLSQAYLKNKAIEAEAKQIAEEKKSLSYQVETLKREIASALQDRDKALKECNDLRQRGGEFKERSQEVKTRYDSAYRERDTGRKDRRETQSSSMDLFGKGQKERMDNLDQANQEIDRLSKQVDKLQAELSEAFQEAEVCKRRRDWAFSERDKIVMERESIRTLCDRLRKERDRAVSDLAEALRDSDDINKQRAETNKQLKVLKEKMEAQLEKESRMVQLHASVDHNYSHDSAIDTDMQEYDSEMLSIDINGLSSTEDLGVELAEGRDDPQYPNDTGIYVTSVIKGSVADGKLKPNDCIVRVNNVDCRNVSKRFVLETMKSSGSTAVMVVRRRRLYTAQLNKYDHGLTLEAGIHISKIMPGSLAARDGSLAVGDRVVSINNKAVEGLSAREVMLLLNESSETLLITTIKSGAVAITSRQSVASTQTQPMGSGSLFIERTSSSDENDHEIRPPRCLKWPREPSEEKKRNRNSSPVTIEQETDDALAELDSVIDTYHSSKGTVRRRTKHDRNGGTWPKASAGPFIEAGTGTIMHPRKNKERLPLPILMKSGGYSVRDYYNPNESRRPETIDLSVKSGNVEKEVLEYYVKRKSGIDAPIDDRTISPAGGSSPSPEVHSRIHSQLYGSPHFTPHPSFIHPHPHSHQTPPPPSYLPAEASVRNSGLSAAPIYRLHLHSPSVDSQYHKARTLGSGSHHGGGHTSDDGGESSASSSYHHHHYEVATLPSRKRENQRFRIPSNPSVSSGKMSTGSIEKSERASPMSFQIEILSELKSPGTSQKTSSLPDYYWPHKPSRGALRRVHIDKSAEPLGIQISCPKSGGVFVSTVSENSLASQVGLRVGDQLLEVCGINMRSATYQLAASVLRQCGNSITMLVQYSPDKLEGTGSSSSGDSKTRSGTPTPCNSPGTLRKSALSGHLSPLSISQSSTFPTDEPRVLRIETLNKCSNLGISLVGGNAVGIFVHSVQMGSLAYNSGLRTGDRILEYNSTDLRSATAEEAAYELAKPADKVVVLAQYSIDRYNEIKDKPGDSLYIRALCDRSGELSDDVQLKFRKGDILFVDNTMFNGVPGSWRAYLVDESGHHHRCGIIPSKYKVEEEMVVKRSLGDLEGEARRATRRSFFRRKKHQRSDSKELASFSNTNLGWYSDSGTLNEDTSFASYQRVNMLNYSAPRPVLIVGPLSDCVTEKLLQDFPDKFSRFYPEIMHCSQSTMEKGVADNLFVDYRKKGNFFECTTVSALKDKCEKSVHCILEVSLAAVERLHRQQIYPIVLLIKFKSTKQIKEVKDTRYPSDKVTAKAAKEMYEHSLKLEQEYKHYISAVIHAGGVNIAYMCTQIKAAVDIEQKKILWVDANNQ